MSSISGSSRGVFNMKEEREGTPRKREKMVITTRDL